MKLGRRKLLILAILAFTAFDLIMFGHIFAGVSRTLDLAEIVEKNSAEMYHLTKSIKK